MKNLLKNSNSSTGVSHTPHQCDNRPTPHTLSPFFFLLFSLLLLPGCKKEETKKIDNGGGGGDGKSWVIDAQNVQNGSTQIKTVDAFMEQEFGGARTTFATADYSNNAFKLDIPNEVEKKWLTTKVEDANIGWLSIDAYDNSGKNIGFFKQQYGGAGYSIIADYFYSDAAVEFEYYNEYEIDGVIYKKQQQLSVKKGWNMRYLKYEGTNTFSTTEKPAGATFHWEFTSIIN